MRWLINYIRSCFCKHEWELISQAQIYRTYHKDDKCELSKLPYKSVKMYRCKKCGYSKKYSISEE